MSVECSYSCNIVTSILNSLEMKYETSGAFFFESRVHVEVTVKLPNGQKLIIHTHPDLVYDNFCETSVFSSNGQEEIMDHKTPDDFKYFMQNLKATFV